MAKNKEYRQKKVNMGWAKKSVKIYNVMETDGEDSKKKTENQRK